MTEIYKKYSKILFPAILLFIYVIYTVFSWGRWGNCITDSFREIIIPQAILDGKVLYSDITCLYPPLAYYLNALLFKIFGVSLNILYLSAILCSLAVLTVIYNITKKYSSDETAFLTTLSIMFLTTFRIGVTDSASWFFPYSYSFIYAFTSCIFALYFLCLYKETKTDKHLFLASLLTGLSVAFKFDFCLFYLLVFYEIIKNKSFKNFFVSVLLFVSPIIMTYGLWFISGGSIEAFKNYAGFLNSFANSESVKDFNSFFLARSFNDFIVYHLKNSGLAFILNFAEISFLVLFMVLIQKKIKNLPLKTLLLSGTGFFGYFLFAKAVTYSQDKYFNLQADFLAIPYILWFAAFILIVLKIITKNSTKKENFFIFLIAVSLIMSYRLWIAIFNCYIGNFIIVTYLLAFIYLILEVIPEKIPFLKNSLYKLFAGIAVVLYSLIYLNTYYGIIRKTTGSISSKNKEIIYTYPKIAKTYNEIISYVKNNSNSNDVVLVVYESPVINYFADRKTNLKYYALIPHIVESYGEDKILSDLENNFPDFVVFLNQQYVDGHFFGKDYGQKIQKFFEDNYNAVTNIPGEDNEDTIIYKKK